MAVFEVFGAYGPAALQGMCVGCAYFFMARVMDAWSLRFPPERRTRVILGGFLLRLSAAWGVIHLLAGLSGVSPRGVVFGFVLGYTTVQLYALVLHSRPATAAPTALAGKET